MKKIKNSDKLYIGFRDFVDKEKLNEYDDEYFSRKKHTYMFMIPFIHKYIDVISLKSKVTDPNHISLITYFLNDYCSKNSKILKSLSKVKYIPTTSQRKFLFKP
tara:strand:+ start:5437 stop:5748 length:312 start_codon:yes stop_codon:yes gene_type:complete